MAKSFAERTKVTWVRGVFHPGRLRMGDEDKPKEFLMEELFGLRREIAGLKATEAEHRSAEKALLVSELRYRRLFEAAQDGILILDADTGEISDVNPFLMEMLGYSHGDVLGKKLWEIGTFKDVEKSKAAFSELQDKGYVRYEHLPLRTRDGRSIDVEFVSNVYLVDHQRVMQCNIRDISQRKRVEDELRQSEERYRSLFGNMLDGYAYCKMLFDHDRPQDFIYVEVNPAFETLTGLKNVIGQRVSQVIPGIQDSNPELVIVYIWFGFAYGMMLQYGRFCFASASRDSSRRAFPGWRWGSSWP